MVVFRVRLSHTEWSQSLDQTKPVAGVVADILDHVRHTTPELVTPPSLVDQHAAPSDRPDPFDAKLYELWADGSVDGADDGGSPLDAGDLIPDGAATLTLRGIPQTLEVVYDETAFVIRVDFTAAIQTVLDHICLELSFEADEFMICATPPPPDYGADRNSRLSGDPSASVLPPSLDTFASLLTAGVFGSASAPARVFLVERDERVPALASRMSAARAPRTSRMHSLSQLPRSVSAVLADVISPGRNLELFGAPLDVALMLNDPTSRSPVPTLVADCVQYLDDRGLLTGGIFVDAGSTPLLRKLHADYTEGKRADLRAIGDPHTVAAFLLKYLTALPGDLIPEGLMECLSATQATTSIDDHQLYVRVMLAALPQANLDLLEVLTAFLGRALDHGYSNGLNLDVTAAIFGPLFSSTAPPYAIKSLVDDLVRHHEAVFTNKPCPFVACARVVESHEATSEWQVSLYRHRHVMVTCMQHGRVLEGQRIFPPSPVGLFPRAKVKIVARLGQGDGIFSKPYWITDLDVRPIPESTVDLSADLADEIAAVKADMRAAAVSADHLQAEVDSVQALFSALKAEIDTFRAKLGE